MRSRLSRDGCRLRRRALKKFLDREWFVRSAPAPIDQGNEELRMQFQFLRATRCPGKSGCRSLAPGAAAVASARENILLVVRHSCLFRPPLSRWRRSLPTRVLLKPDYLLVRF